MAAVTTVSVSGTTSGDATSAPARKGNSAPARKGRGALSNAAGRFEVHRGEAFDDGWDRSPPGEGEPELDDPALRTEVLPDTSRSIIATNKSPDIPFDRSINPYRGCEHGCVYCFARPTHAYLGLSPGLDFETRIFAKYEAARLLRGELARRSYRPAPIAIGANTDPYQPVERRLEITRSVIEVLAQTRHPFGIVTKSNLVLRDLDLLAPLAAERLVSVAVSVTTLDRDLARRMEPRAPTPARRLAAIEGLARAGVPVSVLAAPMIPGLNDQELEAIVTAAHAAGACDAGYVLLRVPLEIKDLVAEWLDHHAPGRAKRVFSHLRQAHDGKAYDARYFHRMRGTGAYAALLKARMARLRRALAMDDRGAAEKRWTLDTSRFVKPAASAADERQLSLF